MPAVPSVEIVGRGDSAGRPFVLANHAGLLYRLALGSDGQPAVDTEVLDELGRVYEENPELARSMGSYLADLGTEAYPLSRDEALSAASSQGIAWTGTFAFSPEVETLRVYRSAARPLVRESFLLVLLGTLFLSAILLSPLSIGLGLPAGSRVPTVAILVLSLLLVTILLVARSVSALVAWGQAVRNAPAAAGTPSPLRRAVLGWALQTALLIVGFAVLAAAFLGLLAQGG